MPRLTLPAYAGRALIGRVSGKLVVSGVTAHGVDNICSRAETERFKTPLLLLLILLDGFAHRLEFTFPSILLVRPARVERATLCLEGRCSIHLSYGRNRFTLPVRRDARKRGCPAAVPAWMRFNRVAFLTFPAGRDSLVVRLMEKGTHGTGLSL